MNHRFSHYTRYLVDEVYYIISGFFLSDTIENIIQNNIVIPHFQNDGMLNYHKYYFDVLKDEKRFLEQEDFFREFAQKNKIEGLTYDFFDRLEKNRTEILSLINDRYIRKVYTNYFSFLGENQVSHNNHNSYFSKLVHVFLPNEFCMLDNRIKTFFGLGNESFYIAWCAISEAYDAWRLHYIDKSNTLMRSISQNKFYVDNKFRFSEMKIMDMIFYTQSRNKSIYNKI